MGPNTRWMDSSELASSSIHRWVSHVPSTRQSSETCLEAVWSGWTSQTHCPGNSARCWFPDVLGWHYVEPTYATCGHGRLWNGYTIQEWHPLTYTATISAEFREELDLMDDNSRPHRAHLVNEFLHDNNIAREASMFSRHKPYRPCLGYIEKDCFWTWTTNHSERSTPICRWGVGQSGPTGPWWISEQYFTSYTGMHKCKKTCYWVLEVLVYSANWHTNSKSLAVLLYNLQFFWFSWAIQRTEMLFLSISIPFLWRFRNSQKRDAANFF